LGILVAKSSVTNCILLSENNAGQFMMGTVDENSEETNYIVRIEGISPIIAFATAVCRKFFVFYS
jgi:NOL1/NOP2/fmu family ribosome biogenesis protein